MNSGEIWKLIPSEVQSKAKAVTKTTDNKGGGSAGTPSATTDKVFLLSSTEVWGDLDEDGTQYEYYKSKGVTKSNYPGASLGSFRRTRSVSLGESAYFLGVNSTGDRLYAHAVSSICVCPAWCF